MSHEVLGSFYDRHLILDVLYELKSGKEATVYCCSGHPDTGMPLLAAKVYRGLDHRNFRNEAMYRDSCAPTARRAAGPKNRRLIVALEKKTRFGREVQYSSWISREWETLQHLHHAGVTVPTPVAIDDGAILMEFLGDETGAAPKLQESRLDGESAARLLDSLLDDIRSMLRADRIHGDLSPFNILVWKDRARVIDVPQAVDARFSPNARWLLQRDVENVCHFFRRHGIHRDAGALVDEAWSAWQRGRL